MEFKKDILLAAFIIVGFMMIVAFSMGIGQTGKVPADYDAFAKCLSDSGAKMYGASWCSHCKTQKAAFGESWQYVNYVECSQFGSGQSEECAAAGIRGYPTWIFGDGTRASGELSFEELSEYSGCTLD